MTCFRGVYLVVRLDTHPGGGRGRKQWTHASWWGSWPRLTPLLFVGHAGPWFLPACTPVALSWPGCLYLSGCVCRSLHPPVCLSFTYLVIHSVCLTFTARLSVFLIYSFFHSIFLTHLLINPFIRSIFFSLLTSGRLFLPILSCISFFLTLYIHPFKYLIHPSILSYTLYIQPYIYLLHSSIYSLLAVFTCVRRLSPSVRSSIYSNVQLFLQSRSATAVQTHY